MRVLFRSRRISVFVSQSLVVRDSANVIGFRPRARARAQAPPGVVNTAFILCFFVFHTFQEFNEGFCYLTVLVHGSRAFMR